MPVAVLPMNFQIKAGDANATQHAKWKPLQDIYIYSLSPHMHLLGKSMNFTATYADGKIESLLSVPRFDFNWQTTYRLANPKFIPKGTVIEITSVHDNSTANPRNPRKVPIDLKWGESTTDEMSIGFVGYWHADENLNAQNATVAAAPK